MEKLKNVISDILKIPHEDVVSSLSMASTDSWDSLKHMELIFRIEEVFSITFSGDEIAKMVSIEAIAEVLSIHQVDLS